MKSNRRIPITLTAATLAVTALLAASGCAPKPDANAANKPAAGAAVPGQPAADAPAPVRVATAKRETVTRYISVTGNLAATESVGLSPKLAAKVVSVAGREGAPVRKGQVVVQQDTSDYVVALKQAQANLQAAEARLKQSEAAADSARVKLSQAQTQYKLQIASSNAAVADAQQQVKSAEAQLELAKQPQRSQEIAVAENAVAQAQANYDRAKSDRARYESLVKEGAAAQITLDQYINTEAVNKAALDSAKQQLDIAKTGGREASIQNAETAVQRARWQLRLAQANQAQITVKQEDIKSARAAVTQAEADVRASRATVAQNQAAVATAQLNLNNTSLVSPINGTISERQTEPGQMAAPGTSVVTIVALNTVYFEAQVPETDLNAVRPGQAVEVRLDAFPGKTFNGKISRVYPTGSTSSRTVIVRVEIDNSGSLLRPGLFARGQIVAEQRLGVVVPKDAVVNNEDQTVVYVAENGARAVRRVVKTGIQTADTVEILSGVQAGESVIVAGQNGLKDGAPIKPEEANRQTASL